MSERWIVIRHWDRYQHFHDRDPIWLKDHRSQHSNDGYLDLSFHLRGLLKDLRIAYGDTDGILPVDTRSLTRRFGQRVMTRDLESLNHAGFIDFVDIRPISLTRSREKRREENKKAAVAKPPRSRQLDDAHRANAAAYRPFPEPDQPDIDPAGIELLKEWLKR